jgi:hypothetical protein
LSTQASSATRLRPDPETGKGKSAFRRNKALAVLVSTGLAAILYVGMHGALLTFSRVVESRTTVYPYKEEDWLRYLMPSLFAQTGSARLLLAGESNVRESLLFEEFDRAFPNMRAFEGGISLGTIDDVLISLQYAESVYGPSALPRMMVLGVSLRFVANIPGDRPFFEGLNNYSPHFSVRLGPSGPYMEKKTPWEGWVSWTSFHAFKSQPRYRAAIAAEVRDRMNLHTDSTPAKRSAREFLSSFLRTPAGAIREVAQAYAAAEAYRWASPYRYQQLPPLLRENQRQWLRSRSSWWYQVHRWDARANWQNAAERLRALRRFAEERQISLYVFNLPESIETRQLYDPANYAAYMELLRTEMDGVPFLDLREFLPEEEFFDAVHPQLPGARRITNRVIEFIKANG